MCFHVFNGYLDFFKEPMNILIVDRHGGASVSNYLQSVANGRVVGAMIALFLKVGTWLGCNSYRPCSKLDRFCSVVVVTVYVMFIMSPGHNKT